MQEMPETHRFSPWFRKVPWRRARQPTPVFLPGESHGQKSLVGSSSWGLRVRHDWSDWACTQMTFSVYIIWPLILLSVFMLLVILNLIFINLFCNMNKLWQNFYYSKRNSFTNFELCLLHSNCECALNLVCVQSCINRSLNFFHSQWLHLAWHYIYSNMCRIWFNFHRIRFQFFLFPST